MIKAISYWSLDGGLEGKAEIEAAILQAKRHGFNGVELCIAETGVLTPSTDEATCKKYREIAHKHGIAVETMASGITWGCSPSDLSEATRKKSVELHKAALQRAAWLGAKSMLFIPGAVQIPWVPTYGPVPYDKAMAWAREAVQAMAPVAEKVQVEICIENVWNGMFYSPIELRDFVDSFKSQWVGVYFDTGNGMGYEQYPPHWIEYLGQRIKRIHLKDFKKEMRTFAGFCDLLQGDLNWPETMKAINAIGYNKTLVGEMIPSSDEIVARTSKAMDKIMAMNH